MVTATPMSADRRIASLLAQAEQDRDVAAVLLFGSQARGDAGPESDVDVCLVLVPRPYTRAELARKRLEYLGHAELDVHVFQALPLYVRPRVLREGRVLSARDEDALYDVAFQTVRAFGSFRRHYEAYLDEVARGRS
jgi:predicted nucleotidyltransferase